MNVKIENKVDVLNVIRCVAILSVFMLHAKLFSPGDWHLGIHYPWLTYTPAWAGVWIFFYYLALVLVMDLIMVST